MLLIREGTIFDENGTKLKIISCPKRTKFSDLLPEDRGIYSCKHCDQRVIDTSLRTEVDIISLIKHDPNTCLAISRLNPIFQFED